MYTELLCDCLGVRSINTVRGEAGRHLERLICVCDSHTPP